MDDGSTDDTKSIAEQFAERLNLRYFSQPNSGRPAVARNEGLAKTKAELIAFLDSDDWWAPRKLEKSVRALENDADFVYHDLILRSPTEKWFTFRRVRSRRIKGDSREFLLERGNVIPNSSVVTRRQLLLDAGTFDEAWGVRAWEDYELWLRIAENGARFARIRGAHGFYARSDNNLSGLIDSKATLENIKIRFFENRQLPMWWHLGMGYAMLQEGNYLESKKYLRLAILSRSGSRLKLDRLRSVVKLAVISIAQQ